MTPQCRCNPGQLLVENVRYAKATVNLGKIFRPLVRFALRVVDQARSFAKNKARKPTMKFPSFSILIILLGLIGLNTACGLLPAEEKTSALDAPRPHAGIFGQNPECQCQ